MKLSSAIKKTLLKGKAWVGASLIFGLGLGMMTTSCEDMLSPDSERHSYEVAQDTLYSYWGILKSLQNVAERYVILNEMRGDMVAPTSYVSDTISALASFDASKTPDGACAYLDARDFYHVINSCNAYIANCDTMRKTSLNEKYMIKEYAQVEAIRAWVYMQLVLAYGEVPFYLEPILNTDDLDAFMKDKHHETVNADNLVDKLEGRLIPMEYVEFRYGLPQYNNYGEKSFICHSSKCMFPVPLVLADLYLLKGDVESCKKAAQYYYNFLNSDKGGVLPISYDCFADVMAGEEEPIYDMAVFLPWQETGRSGAGKESITCIPSVRGKLDGTVLTDVPRLFGFEATLYTNGNGESSVSSVSLVNDYRRELVASKAYENLCDAQDYETYLVTMSGNGLDWNNAELVALPDVGDARQAYNQSIISRDDNDVILYGHYVKKFCASPYPNGQFSTTSLIVYRQSTVWLRFAEAINRAGFPSYAFAILRNGLVYNPEWYPTLSDYDPDPATATYYWQRTDEETGETVRIPEEEGASVDENQLYAQLRDYFGKDNEELKEEIEKGTIQTVYSAYLNQANVATAAPCFYLDRRELVKANEYPFMNFSTMYLRSDFRTLQVNGKESILGTSYYSGSYPQASSSEMYGKARGIHSRGGGLLKYDERNSSFDYVKKVAEKSEAYGPRLTAEQIYSGEYDDVVTKAVEDLIIDEMGLELAFEGTRFFDLSRVARRRGDASYFADHVARRNGEIDMALYNKLLDKSTWYYPLPAK